MNSQSRISVAMCTFNGSQFVGEQIASIVSQDVKPDEIVVADDGSTDDTLDIVKKCLAEHPSISLRVLENTSTEQLGVARNFSRAVDACGGGIVFLSDQDDVWLTNRVRDALKLFAAHPAALIVACDAYLIDDRGQYMGSTLFDAVGLSPATTLALSSGNAVDLLLRRNDLPGMSMAMRKDLVDGSAHIPAPWMHDYWWATLAALSGGLVVTRVPLVKYRQHANNVLGAGSHSFGARLRKLVMSGSDASRLTRMFSELDAYAQRTRVDSEVHRRAITEKAAFEAERAQLPRSPILRIPAAIRLLGAGKYARYSSNGAMNVFRDLLFAPKEVR